MRKQKGFSLIELLIVVAIILIIAAIAVPNLLRAKISANESSAVGNLRSITTAEISYQNSYGAYGTLAQLGGASPCTAAVGTACLIDNTLASSVVGCVAATSKSGYCFYGAGAGAGLGFTANADPMTPGTTGVRYFYTDATAVIRSNAAAVAAATDPSI